MIIEQVSGCCVYGEEKVPLTSYIFCLTLSQSCGRLQVTTAEHHFILHVCLLLWVITITNKMLSYRRETALQGAL